MNSMAMVMAMVVMMTMNDSQTVVIDGSDAVLYHDPTQLPSTIDMDITTVQTVRQSHRACSRCFPEQSASEKADRLEAIYGLSHDYQTETDIEQAVELDMVATNGDLW